MRRIFRRLLQVRAFSFAALPTLVLSIGATTAVFSIVNAVLIHPLPYPAPDRLVDLSHTLEVSGAAQVDQSDASFLYYRRANHSFEDIGAYLATAVNLGPRLAAGSADDRSARVPAARISAGTFRVLQVNALQGRVFRDEEDPPGAAPTVLIGEHLWRNDYGASPEILGQKLDIDGVPRIVVGIMPASFRFPASETEVWIPIGMDPAKTDSAQFDYRGIGRLRDGASIASAESDLQQRLLELPAAIPGRLTLPAIQFTRMRAVVTPFRDRLVGNIGRILWVVLGAVGCILAIGCANTATLFLIRADDRQSEMAVRRALGASRLAVLKEVLIEASVLALIAGILAVALAAAGITWLQSLDTSIDLPGLAEAGIDGVTLLAAVALSAIVALVVSAVPALRAASSDPALVLHDGGRSTTVGRSRRRLRATLVVIQVALALLLVAGGGLMARSFAALSKVQPGFDPSSVYTFRMALPAPEYPSRDDAVRLIERALDQIAATPGVQAAGATTKLPLMDQGRLDSGLFIKDRPLAPGGVPRVHPIIYASREYFRAMAIPFMDGTTFDPMTPGNIRPQVIVSDTLAHRYWGNETAVGRQIRISPNGNWLTVIGVVRGVRDESLEQPPQEAVYLPLAANDPRWSPRDFAFAVRSNAAPVSIAAGVATTLRRLAPSVPIYGAAPMSALVSHARARTSFLLLLLAISSIIAMILGAVGLFGMCAYAATLRRREIAIRLALGASPAEIHRMIALQGLKVAAAGVGLGIVFSLAATRTLAALLFGVGPADPLTLAAASIVMLFVAATATWLPAHRASTIDPADTLRSD